MGMPMCYAGGIKVDAGSEGGGVAVARRYQFLQLRPKYYHI